MIVVFTLFLLFAAPLLAGIAAALLYRRTGHSFLWQVVPLAGFVAAVLVLSAPIEGLFHSPTRIAQPLALGLGYLVPTALFLALALKRWPVSATGAEVTE